MVMADGQDGGKPGLNSFLRLKRVEPTFFKCYMTGERHDYYSIFWVQAPTILLAKAVPYRILL